MSVRAFLRRLGRRRPKREEDFTRDDLFKVWDAGEPVARVEPIQFRGWIEYRYHERDTGEV